MSLDKGIRHTNWGFCRGKRTHRQHQKLKKAQRELQDEYAHRQRKTIEDPADVRKNL